MLHGCSWGLHWKPGQLGLSVSLLSIVTTPSCFFYIQINFLIVMWKPKIDFFFSFVFAPCGRSNIFLPIASEPPSLVVKTLFIKKRKKNSLVFLAAFAFSPLFLPHKKKLSTRRHRDWGLSISAKISSSQSAALLHCLPLIPLKPLGPLIRKRSALMFGPPADELYLWVVWADADEYIHICACESVCVNIVLPNVHFQQHPQPPLLHNPPKKEGRKKHSHANRQCHTQLEAWEVHSIQNRRTTNRGPL